MNDMRYRKTRKKTGGKGFYVALGICLLAIGLAAWSTYDNVAQYTAPPDYTQETPTSSQAIQAENTISGVTDNTQETASEKDTEEKSRSESEEPVSSAIKENKEETNVNASVAEEEAVETDAKETDKDNAAEEKVEETIITPPAQVNTSFIYPVSNVVTKDFSGQDLMYSETMKDWRLHTGVDLAASIGDTVRSIGYGTVTEIYYDELFGNIIVIAYDDITAKYCGLGSTALVNIGDTVTAGQDIGSVHIVPCESIEAPHLHFEVLQDGANTDPLSLFS